MLSTVSKPFSEITKNIANKNQSNILLPINQPKESKKDNILKKMLETPKIPKKMTFIEDPEDSIYKNKLIKKIEIYLKTYPHVIKNIKFNNEKKQTIEELENILTEIKDQVGNRNMTNNIENLINLLPVGIEKSGNLLGLQLDGYASVVTNQEYKDTINEILIEYNFTDCIKIRPEMRLAYLMIIPAIAINNINSLKTEQLNNGLQKNSGNLANKYNNI